jgi:hypothetical protein
MDDQIEAAKERCAITADQAEKAKEQQAAQKAQGNQGSQGGQGQGANGAGGAGGNTGGSTAQSAGGEGFQSAQLGTRSDKFDATSKDSQDQKERERVGGASGRSLPQPIQNLAQLSSDPGQHDPNVRQANATRQQTHMNEGIRELAQRDAARRINGSTDSAAA